MKRIGAFIGGMFEHRLQYPPHQPNVQLREWYYAGRSLARRFARLPEG